MHAHDQIRIVIGNDDPDPLAFDLSKITPPVRWLPFFPQRIGDHEFRVRSAQLVEPQSIPGVLGEPHAPLRAERHMFSPSIATGDVLELMIISFGPWRGSSSQPSSPTRKGLSDS